MQTNNLSESHKLIDNVSEHPTPEGLMLTLVPAGVMPRVSAWLMDCAIRYLIVTVLSIPLALLGATGIGLYSILIFVIFYLYPVYFEVRKNGATPGKKRYKIYVCHDDGTPVTLQSSMIRNLIRVVDFLPFMYAVGVFALMFNHKSQRLGDMVAGTVVVYREEDNLDKIYRSVYGLVNKDKMKKNNIHTHSSPQDVNGNGIDDLPYNSDLPYDPNAKKSYDISSPLFTFPLNLAEQQALLSLADRLIFLPIPRQQEITNHLSPLIICYNQFGIQSKNEQQMVYQAVLDKATAIRGGYTGSGDANGHKQNGQTGGYR